MKEKIKVDYFGDDEKVRTILVVDQDLTSWWEPEGLVAFVADKMKKKPGYDGIIVNRDINGTRNILLRAMRDGSATGRNSPSMTCNKATFGRIC